MTKIFKYKLEITGTQQIEIPLDSRILSVQMQKGALYLWAKVEPETPKVKVIIQIYGTGVPIAESNLRFLGTVQMMEGDLVWHVFVQEPNVID